MSRESADRRLQAQLVEDRDHFLLEVRTKDELLKYQLVCYGSGGANGCDAPNMAWVSQMAELASEPAARP